MSATKSWAALIRGTSAVYFFVWLVDATHVCNVAQILLTCQLSNTREHLKPVSAHHTVDGGLAVVFAVLLQDFICGK